MKNIKTLVLLLALALPIGAQTKPTNLQRMFYNGGGVLQYICEAPMTVASTAVSVAFGNFTNVVVNTNIGTVTAAAHGLYPGAYVTISGSTTAALNGSYTVLTVPTVDTYTVATTGVSNATYITGITVSTNSPLYSSPVWMITVMRYDGSGNIEGVTLGGGSISQNFRAKCSDRASY